MTQVELDVAGTDIGGPFTSGHGGPVARPHAGSLDGAGAWEVLPARLPHGNHDIYAAEAGGKLFIAGGAPDTPPPPHTRTRTHAILLSHTHTCTCTHAPRCSTNRAELQIGLPALNSALLQARHTTSDIQRTNTTPLSWLGTTARPGRKLASYLAGLFIQPSPAVAIACG